MASGINQEDAEKLLDWSIETLQVGGNLPKFVGDLTGSSVDQLRENFCFDINRGDFAKARILIRSEFADNLINRTILSELAGMHGGISVEDQNYIRKEVPNKDVEYQAAVYILVCIGARRGVARFGSPGRLTVSTGDREGATRVDPDGAPIPMETHTEDERAPLRTPYITISRYMVTRQVAAQLPVLLSRGHIQRRDGRLTLDQANNLLSVDGAASFQELEEALSENDNRPSYEGVEGDISVMSLVRDESGVRRMGGAIYDDMYSEDGFIDGVKDEILLIGIRAFLADDTEVRLDQDSDYWEEPGCIKLQKLPRLLEEINEL